MLTLGRQLGQGGQGTVHQVVNKKINKAVDGGWDVAYKEYSPAVLPELDAAALASQVDLPSTLSTVEGRWLCDKTAWPAAVGRHSSRTSSCSSTRPHPQTWPSGPPPHLRTTKTGHWTAPSTCRVVRGRTVTGGSSIHTGPTTPPRTETGIACLKKPPHNSNPKEVKPDPFGYAEARFDVRRLGLEPGDHLARCHIIAARFGGANKLEENLSPCAQRIANNNAIGMSRIEGHIAQEIAQNPEGSVWYLVQPLFRNSQSSIPLSYQMMAIFYSPSGIPYEVESQPVANMVLPPRGLTNIGN